MTTSPLAAAPPWNLVAGGYERALRPYLETFSRSGLARVPFDRRSRVIDIACGPGTTALLLAPSVERVTCLDFAESMLDELRANAEAAGVTNLEIVKADGQALPFPEASFDLAVSMFGLMFFPDRRKGFAEVSRVLRSGGHALVSSWAPRRARRLRSPCSTRCGRKGKHRGNQRHLLAWKIQRSSNPKWPKQA